VEGRGRMESNMTKKYLVKTTNVVEALQTPVIYIIHRKAHQAKEHV
jgi:hypothetical protein